METPRRPAALCCTTPWLVISLSALGLGAITGYFDYVLLPGSRMGPAT
ncbi:MAG: mercury resistance system transport protein MerF [Nitrospirae bacterium]|nr:mercury resistance system transport protein MerF [Nitrospirota bacterium]